MLIRVSYSPTGDPMWIAPESIDPSNAVQRMPPPHQPMLAPRTALPNILL